MVTTEHEAAGDPPDSAVERWMDKGDGDLRTAEALLGLGEAIPPSIIGFHAQQAVEKYLKATLVAEGAAPPREHSISKLRALVGSVELEQHLSLTRFAVLERYPRLQAGEADEPTRREVWEAVAHAQAVRQTIVMFLQRRRRRRRG